jgi:hypothetical protein
MMAIITLTESHMCAKYRHVAKIRVVDQLACRVLESIRSTRPSNEWVEAQHLNFQLFVFVVSM